MSQVQWGLSLIPALERHKQIDLWAFEASLGSIDRRCCEKKSSVVVPLSLVHREQR